MTVMLFRAFNSTVAVMSERIIANPAARRLRQLNDCLALPSKSAVEMSYTTSAVESRHLAKGI